MKEHMANALAIAKFLESHSKVDKVTKYISLDKVTCLGSISNARITSPT
jgi:O-acetylhomoserine/O-acetylserine sulfhydrylase-like pyridoxal-dependent enzyme